MEHDSQVILDGASNVRDLCWALGTRRSREARRVIRSGALDDLSEVGRCAFDKLGIAVVIDLRGNEEVQRASEIEGTTRVHLPIAPSKELLAQLWAGTLTLDSTVAIMKATYRRYVVDYAPVFATVFDYILNAKQRPVLFHCAEGKDRTGLAAALVLTALAVPWPVILEDYMLSNRLYRSPFAGKINIPEDIQEAMFEVRPSYLEAAFAAMTECWGGPEQYLAEALSLGPREREALRQSLN